MRRLICWILWHRLKRIRRVKGRYSDWRCATCGTIIWDDAAPIGEGFLGILLVGLCAFLLGSAEKFRWYRQLRGGVWERWWVDHPVCGDVWHQVPDDPTKRWSDKRPNLLCRGTPVVEDHRRGKLAE